MICFYICKDVIDPLVDHDRSTRGICRVVYLRHYLIKVSHHPDSSLVVHT
nr:MAG TPA: hypothetical protein [Caudoviricetes sp.]DAX41468.1 MAG TPA: hypothetical protein [Caudoviricetes sp.]